MFTFSFSILLLILGYIVYGHFVARVFGPDQRATPAVAHPDGIDFVVLPNWKIFMIQFLNIAGTGPIFGAIMGAKFGPSAYLWIVFGCIFAGATHDYLSGMLSLRNNGAGLPETIGKYLGNRTRKVMLVFTIFLLLMVGAVFVYSPALILGGLCSRAELAGLSDTGWVYMWCAVIFVYYIIATMIPIDKVIGKIYPLFAISMLFMALSLMIVLFVKWPTTLPELYDGLDNLSPESGAIFPCLFITIACGAISGFHATQSPLMARCMRSEMQARPIFYGAMITEGIVALVWATVASYFFYGGAAQEMGQPLTLQAPQIVTAVSREWLGVFGGLLALLGVVAAPITSGDTALRSARLIIAEFFHIEQRSIHRRIYLCIPLFAATFGLLWFNIADKNGFQVIWSYFGWANQALSVFTLWAITVYLARSKKLYVITLIPALFMTCVCVTYFCIAPNCLGLPETYAYGVGGLSACIGLAWFGCWKWGLCKNKTIE